MKFPCFAPALPTLVILLVAACAAPQKAAPVAPAPVVEPAPVTAPEPAPVAVAAPVAASPPPPVKAQPCGRRHVTFSVARATGPGAYITSLACSDQLFTVSSDRATSDGRELKASFQVAGEVWEQAYQQIYALNWQTFDDQCSPRETAQGRGDGPVYRISVEDGSNKRSFMCRGTREYIERVDAVQKLLIDLLPPEPIAIGPSGVGVLQCDDYLDRYEKCVNTKVPAAKRRGFIEAIQFTRQAMHETLMRNPESEDALANQCKEMHAAARTTMATFKCKM